MTHILLFLYNLTRLHAYVMTRFWRRVLGAYLAKNAKQFGSIGVHGYGRFIGVENLVLGHNIHMNAGAYWVCDGGLTVGDNVHIGLNNVIYTRNHNHKGKALPYDDENIARPVEIGRNAWLGANVTVVPGTCIGEGVIVGAGSVVHGTIPAFSIVGSPGPSILSERDMTHYKDLDSRKQYGGAGGKLIAPKNKKD